MGDRQGQAMAITHEAGSLWMVDFSIWLADPNDYDLIREEWLHGQSTFQYSKEFPARNQASIQQGVSNNETVVRSVAAASAASQAAFEHNRETRNAQHQVTQQTGDDLQRKWGNHFNGETTVVDPNNPSVSYQAQAGYDAYYSDGYGRVLETDSTASPGPNWTLMEQK
jgi:hypothetical protein